VSSQIVAQQNTNNLCYKMFCSAHPKYRAEPNVNATKLINTNLDYLNYDLVPQVKCPKGTTKN